MNYTIIVHDPGHPGDASHTALAFSRALLAQGHAITRVFFYHEGVTNALASRVPPQDEASLLEQWRQFGVDTGTELAICIAAALRRGVLNKEEAARYDKPAATADDAFSIVGLGQLIDAISASDRTVTFTT